MNDDFLDFSSAYFSVDRKSINKKTKIETLERNVHDRIGFTFELEKHYKIQLEDEEISKLHKLGDFQILLEKKLQSSSLQNNTLKKAA